MMAPPLARVRTRPLRTWQRQLESDLRAASAQRRRRESWLLITGYVWALVLVFLIFTTAGMWAMGVSIGDYFAALVEVFTW